MLAKLAPHRSLRSLLGLALVGLALFIWATGHTVNSIADYVWLTIAVTGLCVQIDTLVDATYDRGFLRNYGYNGQMSILANLHVRNGVVRTFVLTLNCLLGAAAPLIPPIPHPDAAAVPISSQIFGFAVILVLITGEAALVTNSILDRRDRRRMAAMQPPQKVPWQ